MTAKKTLEKIKVRIEYGYISDAIEAFRQYVRIWDYESRSYSYRLGQMFKLGVHVVGDGISVDGKFYTK